MESTTSIPRDIVFEIFSRLPIESLMRFKCVSKFYKSLISQSVFADIHQCNYMSGIKFIVRQRTKLYTIEAIEEGIASPLHIENFYEKLFYDHIMCVNGLFCCSMEHMERVTICNPSTRVVRTLPHLIKEFVTIDYPKYFYSMGFDLVEKTYKVLMTLYDYSRIAPTRNWVFTLGKDESWREIKSITDFTLIEKNAIYIDGVIYMLSYAKQDNFIVAFDVNCEKFRIITLWDSPNHIGDYYSIIKVNNELAILDKQNLYGGDHMDLWILGKEEWKKHIVQIPQQWGSTEFVRPTFCSSCDGKILFTKRSESNHQFMICFCYDVTEERWKFFEIQGLLGKSLINDIYSCVEGLFPVEKIA